MGVAYNRLSDLQASLALSTSGDSGSPGVFGTGVTLNIDSITITDSEDTVDNSGGQDAVPVMRTTKTPFTVEIETKWGTGFTRPARGKQARLTLVSPGGTDIIQGRITSVVTTGTSDSTLRITLSAYGVAPTIV